jgi:type II secretory pathway component PulL
MQHSIDLLPDSIRVRSQAGARTGRLIATAGVLALLVLVLALHSLVALVRAQEELFTTAAQAQKAFEAEARQLELGAALKRHQSYIEMYDRIATPVHVSAVMATVINCLPESVTLDQFDVDAGARPITRSPRAKGVEVKDELPPRILHGEISGFAASEEHISKLVNRLRSTPPFRDVNLDFSRTRTVNGGNAREFRLSFKIDLDASYEVVYLNEESRHTAAE